MRFCEGGLKTSLRNLIYSIYLFIKYHTPIKIAAVKKPMEMKWL
jgi:hypothetical protein